MPSRIRLREFVAVGAVILILTDGCRAPTRTDAPAPTTQEAPLRHNTLTIEKLEGGFELEAGGRAGGGLNDCAFAYRIVLPEGCDVRLRPDVSQRCTLTTTHTPNTTEFRFEGKFLDGAALLASLGARAFTITFPAGTLTMNGLPAPETRVHISLADGYLSLNGVRIAPLPNIVE